MQLDVLALVEGATSDARGALALVGVNQRTVPAPVLPVTVVQYMVLVFTDELTDSSGHAFSPIASSGLVIRVVDPSGNTKSLTDEDLKLQTEKAWTDVPLVGNVVRDVVFSAEAYGIYVVEVDFSPLGVEPISRRFPIYVVSPPQAAPDDIPRRVFADIEGS